MNKTIFYKFSEILDAMGMSGEPYERIGTIIDESWNATFKGMSSYEDLINELLLYVWQTFDEYYIYKKDFDWFDEEPTLEYSDINIVCKRLANVWNLTCDRYIPLLKGFNKYKEDITIPIHQESSAKTRFNDSPQNEELEGDFNDDNHSTNYTSSVASNNVDEPLADKLDKLYRNWRDVFGDWIREFKGLFMEVFD